MTHSIFKKTLSSILAFCMLFSLLAVPFGIQTLAADPTVLYTNSTHNANGEDGIVLTKTANFLSDGTVDLTVEAYTTGKVTVGEHVTPTDIVLLLDVSGSMSQGETTTTHTSITAADANAIWIFGYYYYMGDGTFYIDLNGNYTRVYSAGYDSNRVEYFYYSTGAGDSSQRHYVYPIVENGQNPDREFDYDVVQFYEETTTTVTHTNMDILKDAVSQFIRRVESENALIGSPSDMHRIAIVKYADDSYYGGSLSLTEGNHKNNNGYNYTEVAKNLTVVDDAGSDTLVAAIESLSSGGATAIDYGIELAEYLIEQRSDGTGRNVVLIAFTDGEPNHSSGYDPAVAADAVQTAHNLKDEGVSIYSISVADGSSATELGNQANSFMHYLSNNYPNATGSGGVITPGEGSPANGYYFTPDNTHNLDAIFTGIAQSIGSPDITLGEEATVVDTISNYFNIGQNAGNAEISVMTSKAKADGSWEAPVTEAGVSYGLSADGKTISVTGFDFDKNFVSTIEHEGGYGKKVVINVKLLPDYTAIDSMETVPDYLLTNEGTAKIVDTHGIEASHTDSPVIGTRKVIYKVDGAEYKTFARLEGTAGITAIAEPVKEGHTFSGWSSTDVNPSAPFTMPGSDVVIEGAFTANTYKVTYRYSGVKPAGATELPNSGGAITVTFGQEYVLEADATAPGYTFYGWESAHDDVDIKNDKFTMPAHDVELYGYFEAGENTPYHVEHWLEQTDGSYKLEERVGKMGETDTTVTLIPNKYEGFEGDETHPDNVLSGTITGDGSLVLKMHYSRKKYDVIYVIDGNIPAGITIPAGESGVYFGDTVKLEDDLVAPGYKFSGWTITNEGVSADANGNFTMPNLDVVISGSFVNALDTPYKVEHYLENADGSYGDGQGSHDPARINNYEGETGSTVTANPIPVTRYILNENHPLTVASATVEADGSTTLKLYYDRLEYKVTYVIDGFVPAGVVLPAEESYKFGETVTAADDLDIVGYEFSGWYNDAVTTDPNYVAITSGQDFTMPAANVIIAGRFTAKSDTEYKVEHYLENLDGTFGTGLGGTAPTSFDTFTGITGATATATPLTVTGFTLDTSVAGTVESGTIAPDGSLVLKLYYTRNKYDVTYIIDGFAPAGVTVPSGYNQSDVKCGTVLDVEAVLSASGYDFVGWYNDADESDANYVEITNGGTFKMPAADVVIAGYFTRASDTPYKVVHYFENLDGTYGNGKGASTPVREDSFTGTTGEVAVYTAMKPTGYVFDPTLTTATPSDTISPAGDTVITLYYNREEYNVTYVIDGFVPAGAATLLPAPHKADFNESVTVADDIEIDGYIFSGWKDDAHPNDPNWRNITSGGTFRMPATDVIIVGSFERAPNTSYKVEHYLENLDGTYGAAVRTDTLTGTTDTKALYTPINPTGYIYNESLTTATPSENIASDGSTVIKLYYERAEYSVTYVINGFKPADATLPAGGSYKFGETVSVAANITAQDYTFSGWSNSANPANPNYVTITAGGTFEMPSADVVISGRFIPLPDVNYHVLHYLENADGTFGNGTGGTTPVRRDQFTSKPGRSVQATAIPFAGFTFDPSNTSTKTSGTIPASGTLVLKLYYTRNQYSVRYRYTGTIPASAPALPNGGNKIMTDYGSHYEMEATPSVYGYTFYGWTSQTEGLVITGNGFTMPAHEVYLVGHFHENVETPYVINHWLQDRNGNYPALPYETETRHAPHTTDATVYAKHFAGFTFDDATTVGEDNVNGVVSITKNIAEDGTTVFDFYYKRDVYTVTYVYKDFVPATAPALPNGGAAINVYAGAYHTVADKPVVAGYTFNGWSVRDNVIALSENYFKMPLKNVVLEGSFEAKNDTPYVVKYFFEELDGTYTENTALRENRVGTTDSVVSVTPPVFAGYIAKSDNVTSGKVTAFPILEINLYYDRAKFDVTYHIIGTVPAGADVPAGYNKTGVKFGESVTVEADLALDGYVFESWRSLQADLTSGSFTMPARNVSIYGRFVKLYTVKYDLNGGKAGSVDYSDETVKSGTVVTVKDAPTRSGYTFKGWVESDTPYSVGDSVTVEGDYTFKAEWKKNGGGNDVYPTYTKYTLTYVSNGGTEYSPEKYMEGAVAKVNKTPERHGYVFEGWFFDEEFKNPASETVVMNKDITVYAQWLEDKVPEALDGDHHFAYVIGYDDGTVRPNAHITRAETAAIFFRLLKAEVRDENLSSESSFDDVKVGEWYNINVSTLEKLGVLIAREGNSFAPNEAITRGEFADICARFDEDPYVIVDQFTDVAGHKFEEQIHEAAAHGWIGGYEDGTFRPDELITRAEAMKMINRVLNRELSDAEGLIEDGMIKWPDNADTTAWYYLDVQEATNNHKFRLKDDKYEEWTELTSGTDWLKFQ